jgi:iron(III) transport system permease protein
VVLISASLLLVVGMAAFGSLVKVWPYNLSFTLNHYTYGFAEAGLEHAYWNSLTMAVWCALLGSAITFTGAYWLEKTRPDQTGGINFLRPLIRFQAMLPMAIPGMVLGSTSVLQSSGQPAQLPVRHDDGTGALTIIHFLVEA